MSFLSALEGIELGSVKNRRDSFTDIERLLRTHSQDLSAVFPNQKSLVDFFDRLTTVVSNDRRAYFSAQSSGSRTAQTTATSKYTESILACRHAVEYTVHILKYKPCARLLSSFLAWLLDLDGRICVLVASDCLKALNEILSYSAHLDHISHDLWDRLCKEICKYLGDVAKDKSSLSSINRRLFPDIARLLRTLTSASCPPIRSNEPFIYRPLITILENSEQISDVEHVLLGACNNVLQHAITNSFSSVREDLGLWLSMLGKAWARDATRRTDLKDEVLKSLVLLSPFVEGASRSAEGAAIRTYAAELSEGIQSTYSKSASSEFLQLADIRLELAAKIDAQRFRSFSLSSAHTRAHRAWIALTLLVKFLAASHDRLPQSALNGHSGSPQRKKPHHGRVHQDLIRHARDPNLGTTITGLQTLAFQSQLFHCTEDTLQEILEFLVLKIADSNAEVVAWAYLALAGFAAQRSASAASLASSWAEIWMKAQRTFKIAKTCRTASYCLHLLIENRLVPKATIANLITPFKTSIDVLGPTTFDEGSIAFVSSLITFCKASRPASFMRLAQSCIEWIFQVWDPGPPEATFRVSTLQVSDVINVIADCTQADSVEMANLFTFSTSFSATLKRAAEAKPLLQYLLDLDESSDSLSYPPRSKLKRIIKRNETDHETGLLTRSLRGHIDECLTRWQTLKEDQPVPDDLIRGTSIALKVCEYAFQVQQGAASLQNVALPLLDRLQKALASVQSDSPKVRVAVEILVAPWEVRPSELSLSMNQGPRNNGNAWRMALSLLVSTFCEGSSSQDDGLMSEQFDDFEHFSGSRPRKLSDNDLSNQMAARVSTLDTAESLINMLQTLSGQQLVLAGDVLRTLYRARRSLHWTEGLTSYVLGEIAETVLQDYQVDRSERTLEMTLQFLLSSFGTWIKTTSTDLRDLLLDLYEHFYATFTSGNMSSAAQVLFAELLVRIWGKDPDFGQGDSVETPSVRTAFFSIIQSGSILTRYHISQRVTEIFRYFTAPYHEAVFDDLQSQIEANPNHLEGLAVRISFLTNLGSNWYTLLRKSVFYIFEIAGQINECGEYATRGLRLVSSAHGFKHPMAMFTAFSPQLFYTWMNSARERSSVADMPVSAFGFLSMDDMLAEHFKELSAQCMLLNKKDEYDWLRKTMNKSDRDMKLSSFVPVFTYAIARDVAASAKQNTNEAEQEIKSIFSAKEVYVAQIQHHLPRIIARAVLATTLDGGTERHLEKATDYKPMHEALKSMLDFAHDSRPPAESLQPSFKGRNLMHALERIARRVSMTITRLLSGPLLVAVLRHILDAIDTSLGALHSRMIVQKVRLVCAIGSATKFPKYLCQMLIHSLRPLLLEPHCISDVIGLLHWIYSRGSHAAEEVVLSLLHTLQITKLALHQSATNQAADSQHPVTVSNIGKFERHLVETAKSLSQALPPTVSNAVASLVDVASKVTYPLKLSHSSPGAALLRQLLNLRKTSYPVFGRRDTDELIRFALYNAEAPHFQDDAFGSHADAVLVAEDIFSMIDPVKLADDMFLWVGRLSGRFYSATGSSITAGSAPDTASIDAQEGNTFDSASRRSQGKIINLLVELLDDPSRTHVSAAERTLRCLIESFARSNELDAISQLIPDHIVEALRLPEDTEDLPSEVKKANTIVLDAASKDKTLDARGLAYHILVESLQTCRDDAFLGPLLIATHQIEPFAEKAFCFVLHLVLTRRSETQKKARDFLSGTAQALFRSGSGPRLQLMLQLLIYLLQQPLRDERARPDRLQWLNVDYGIAVKAAISAGQGPASLLLLELDGKLIEDDRDTFLRVFNMLDDPDSSYSVARPFTLAAMSEQIVRENDPWASLRIHSALINTAITTGDSWSLDAKAAASALSRLRLDELTEAFPINDNSTKAVEESSVTLTTSRRLYEWDIAAPQIATPGVALFEAYQSLATTASPVFMLRELDNSIIDVAKTLHDVKTFEPLQTLAVMTEMSSLLERGDSGESFLTQADEFGSGWDLGKRHELLELLSHRQTVTGILRRNPDSQGQMDIRRRLALELRAGLQTCKLAADAQATDVRFTEAMALYRALPLFQEHKLHATSIVTKEFSLSMWMPSQQHQAISMLQGILATPGSEKEFLPVHKAVIYAELGRKTAELRLEQPADIMTKYLRPALQLINKDLSKSEEAMIYHEFANFTDQQLQDARLKSELARLKKLRETRFNEIKKLESMNKEVPSYDKQMKADIVRRHKKERAWYEMEDADYRKLRAISHDFAQEAIRNYLRALCVSDEYNHVAVRFFSLWMEYRDLPQVTEAVEAIYETVPSWKFVELLNQILSRVEDDGSNFQRILQQLLGRMCKKHPYHCVHSLFASCHATVHTDDVKAKGRKTAVDKIAKALRADKSVGAIFNKIWDANKAYDQFAQIKYDKTGRTTLKSIPGGRSMDRTIPELSVAPPTLSLPIRPAGAYDNVPTIQRFRSQVTIASGISAPKILTALGTDGKQYKFLCKGGNDDLRQDAIMEQVFYSVSGMLKKHEAARRRHLGIRTYIVLPLTSNSGIIEFVPNSLPLHDFLVPAHEKYHPNDLKANKAREMIRSVQESDKATRVKALRDVNKRYQPVLRFFFLERFEDPSEWYAKRLAYSRSTAVASMLGYVLGLGDRHCHNILLDERSGEVIHIDLGIAFENGRVLPVPEVVPFRLTRDIVDGMGVSGVEGVFRRCCEVAIDALRLDKAGIMTILDVLRYDPLYSWTINPLRARRVQEDASQGLVGKGGEQSETGAEADRALGVVEGKLTSNLSKEAQVSELIQVATDEKNLALLFAGWAAYN